MDVRSLSRHRVARHRAAQRERGLRPVVLWLPDEQDPAVRERLAEECRRLSCLTAEETAIADEFEQLAGETEGWR
jgi:hypothetical protein